MINKSKTYFRTLKLSLLEPKYYQDILKANFKFSLKFFIISFILLSITRSLSFIFLELPKIKLNFNNTLNSIEQNFPKNLVINWDKNKLSLEGQESLEINYPEFIQVNSEMPQKLAFLTNSEININNIDKNYLFLFDTSNLYAYSQPDYQGVALNSLPVFDQELKINYQDIVAYKPKLESDFNQVTSNFVYFSPVIFFFTLVSSRLWIVFFEIILAYLLIRINKINLKFTKLFQISLHIMVILEIVWQVSKLLYPTHNMALINIGYWVILIFIYLSNKKAVKDLSQPDKDLKVDTK